MPNDDIGTLFRLGHYASVVAELPADDHAFLRLPIDQRLIFAHALYHTGGEQHAALIVARENRAEASTRVRAWCEFIEGLLRRRMGDAGAALKHFEAALRLAKDSRDHNRAAWAALQAFRLRAEIEPVESVMAYLPAIRHHVALAADSQVSIYLHDSLALVEAAGGHPSHARNHLRICRSLLPLNPNAWLEQVVASNGFFVDFVESRYSSALHWIRTAKALIPITGDRHKKLINCNEGHVLLALGRFDAAIRCFQEVASHAQGAVLVAALDGLARAYLATDDTDACKAVLDHWIGSVGDNQLLANSFSGRWTPITRIKLSLRLRSYNEALEQIKTELERAQRLNDDLLRAFLLCLKAEALASVGHAAGAGESLFHVVHPAIIDTPDLLAAYYRASGILLLHWGSSQFTGMFDRAEAIWTHQGNRCALLELRHAKNAIGLSRLGEPQRQRQEPVMSAIGNLGSACRLSYDSVLLGRELASAIRSLECSPNIEIVRVANGFSGDSIDDRAALVLGEDNAATLVLTCQIPATPEKALILGDVLRIGRAALALDRMRRDERSRVTARQHESSPLDADTLFFSTEMQELLATVQRVASTHAPVLITGETGTGKEIVARLIHGHSRRSKGKFIPFNCTAASPELLDSQLFGHRRGAFTGAIENFGGVIRAAAGGTLFLDEVGETPSEVQPKLLRFLESSEIHPIGDALPTKVDVRIVAATNAELDSLVATGRFRQDLFYRLNVVRLHVPPLRERRVEIATLASHYLRKFAQEYQKGDLRLSDDTIEYLVLFRWPGNVRQLVNEMRRMAALAENDAVLMPAHLSPDIFSSRRTLPPSEHQLEPTEVIVRLDQSMSAAVAHLERAMIDRALRECDGRLEETAARLGLSRKGLYLKRQRLGIDSPVAEDTAT